jgi:hypothetical protein
MGYLEDKVKTLNDLLTNIKKEEKNLSDLYNKFSFVFQIGKEEIKTRLDKLESFGKSHSLKNGIPYLAEVYDEYFAIQEKIDLEYLTHKTRLARGSADEIRKKWAKNFRDAQKKAKTLEYILKYYENLFPYLKEIRNDIDDFKIDNEYSESYQEEDREDFATQFLAPEEYYKLSEEDKYQRALDRYLTKKLSLIEIGKMYERYIGYLYEKDGFIVEYKGIIEGVDDLGRDLICKKGNDIIIIQCKMWSQFKKIHEKHIFQFFGTVFEYRDMNALENNLDLFKSNVKGVFFTTTQLSERAKRFAKHFDITVKDNFIFDKTYPMIKCNINKGTNERIYHLPFDQQYDKTKIDPKQGEFYVKTIKEAMNLGFRRAKKWMGN